jgi:hypothetical protein
VTAGGDGVFPAVPLPDDLVERMERGVESLGDSLAALRGLVLPFPWPFVEPDTARQWIKER